MAVLFLINHEVNHMQNKFEEIRQSIGCLDGDSLEEIFFLFNIDHYEFFRDRQEIKIPVSLISNVEELQNQLKQIKNITGRQFNSMVRDEYLIIRTSDQYSFSLISSPHDSYMALLSRIFYMDSWLVTGDMHMGNGLLASNHEQENTNQSHSISQTSQTLFSPRKETNKKINKKTFEDRYEELTEQLEKLSLEDSNLQSQLKINLQEFKMKYICQLTQEIFEEPVIVSSGYTFEKDLIQQIMDENSVAKCPISKETLQAKIMIPNLNLRSNLDFELTKIEIKLKESKQIQNTGEINLTNSL
jgi:hypothetical protein